MYLHLPMGSKQPWNHKVACVTVRGRHKEKKVHKDRRERKPHEVKKPSESPKAKKHKPMDSDEDDEVQQNEP